MNTAYTTINSFIQKHAFSFGVFVTVFAFVFFSFGLVVANGQTLTPNDSHIVNLYVDGQETSAPTRAQTVGDFLQKAGIEVKPADLVEPGIDTPIDADNFKVQIYRAKPVTITDGIRTERVLTPHQTPEIIAQKAGFSVNPEDKFTFSSAENFIQESLLGEKLTIDYATPVLLSLYGSPATVYRTHTSTVGEFIKERGIVPEAGASLSPGDATPLTDNLLIYVSKFGKSVVTADEPVPFEVATTNDPNQPAGKVTITTPGVLGKKQVIYELELRDGKEIGRRILQEVVTAQPQKQTQTRGTKVATVSGTKAEWMAAAGISPADYFAVDFVIGHESGWRPGALNAGGCAGLGQACPGSKLARACPDWQTNPVCQLQFFSGYAQGRYGGWQGAYTAWMSKGWW